MCGYEFTFVIDFYMYSGVSYLYFLFEVFEWDRVERLQKFHMVINIHGRKFKFFVDKPISRKRLKVKLIVLLKELGSAFVKSLDHFIVVFVQQCCNRIIEFIDAEKCSVSKYSQYPFLYSLYTLLYHSLVLWFPWSCRLYGTVIVTCKFCIAFIDDNTFPVIRDNGRLQVIRHIYLRYTAKELVG